MTHDPQELRKEYAKLTDHPKGSILEMWTISFPLMLSILSGNLMLFFDRLILAQYSIEGMTAAAAASITCMIFLYGSIGIASIAEVFVGQYNGKGEHHRVGHPVWQMLWFSLFCGAVFVAIAFWGGPYLVSDYYYSEYGLPYFQWILFLGVAFPAQAALSSFFVGIGRVRIITYTTILANILNVLLDIVFVFGVKGVTPSLGVKGAAIATGIAQLTQVAIFLVIFLNRQNRKEFHTHDLSIKPRLFGKCLRIGGPSAAGHMIEITAWSIITQMMIAVSELHLIAIVVGQTFYGLIAFGMEGLQKGVTTIASNFIGGKQWQMVRKAWSSAVKMMLMMAAVFSVVMLIYPYPIIYAFIPENLETVSEEEVVHVLRIVCGFVWLYFILDGMTWISAGILTAGGDTVFIMFMNAIGAWLFALVPIYYFVYLKGVSPFTSWLLICFYGFMNAICFFIRYKQEKWSNQRCITD